MFFGLFKRGPKKSPGKKQEVEGTVVGDVTHYFAHCKACVIKLKGPLKINDVVRFIGHTTDFKQKVTSMQIDRKPIESATSGAEIGLLVKKRVRIADKVYKVS